MASNGRSATSRAAGTSAAAVGGRHTVTLVPPNVTTSEAKTVPRQGTVS